MIRFPCVRCGRPVQRVREKSGGPLTIRCPHCRFRMYDYPRPCAGMLVLKRGSLLVVRRGHPPKRGWLDTPGGFIDAGESIEGAARRELCEETGLEVGRCEAFGMYWDRYYLDGFGYFPTMNFYFLARWRSGEPRASDDAASVLWMPLGDVVRAKFAFAHMREVFEDLRKRAG